MCEAFRTKEKVRVSHSWRTFHFPSAKLHIICKCRNTQKLWFLFFFLFFLSHCHALWVSTNYVWQEHVPSVTHLSRIHCLVTAMWQENNLTVTHNALIHNKYDSVIGKTLKLFLHKRGNTSANRTFISLFFWCKAVATPIQVQFSFNKKLEIYWTRNWCVLGDRQRC